jgi:hypothetical protein
MPIGSILLGLALVFGVGLFVTRPFWLPKPAPAGPITRRKALQLQKAVLLDEIKALEFDYETGKMPEEIFQSQRERLVHQTAEILREIDQLDPAGDEPVVEPETPAPAAPMAPVDESMRAEIEAAVAQLRLAQPSPEPVKIAPAVVAAGKANEAAPATGRFCSQCGNARETGDKFCAYCGHKF